MNELTFNIVSASSSNFTFTFNLSREISLLSDWTSGFTFILARAAFLSINNRRCPEDLQNVDRYLFLKIVIIKGTQPFYTKSEPFRHAVPLLLLNFVIFKFQCFPLVVWQTILNIVKLPMTVFKAYFHYFRSSIRMSSTWLTARFDVSRRR